MKRSFCISHTFGVVLGTLVLCAGIAQAQPASAKSGNYRPFDQVAASFVETLEHRELDKFVNFYADPVVYRDLVYGSTDHFSREKLSAMFQPLFSPTDGWKIAIITSAVDNKTQVLMLKLDVTFPTGTVSEYGGWFKFDKGLIVEQMDFSMYPIEDLLVSPRFREYFENARLEVVHRKN